MADYGIKVSRVGEDISSIDTNDMNFSSAAFLLKTIATGYITDTLPAIVSDNTNIDYNFNMPLPYRAVVGGYWSTDFVNWSPCGYRYQAEFSTPIAVNVGASGPGYIRFIVQANIQ